MNAKEFFDSLKKVFADLLPLKTADSNYAVSLFNKADGTPAGLMDLPALASVLGANGTLSNNTSIESLTYSGKWFVASSHPDNPTAATSVLVSEFATNSTYGYHIIKSSGFTLIRHYFGGWSTTWQRLDNFGCDTPEALANLLGVGKFVYTGGPHNSGVNTTTTKTAIPVNGNNQALYCNSALLLVGLQFSSGNSTAAGIYMIRRGYDNNYYSVDKISYNSGDQRLVEPTFSVSDDGYLQIIHNGNMSYRSFG